MTDKTCLVPATEPTAPSLLKMDALGRMQRIPEHEDEILDEFERSGLIGPKFAGLCGVKYQPQMVYSKRALTTGLIRCFVSLELMVILRGPLVDGATQWRGGDWEGAG